jgi:hypothetical protein
MLLFLCSFKVEKFAVYKNQLQTGIVKGEALDRGVGQSPTIANSCGRCPLTVTKRGANAPLFVT